MMRNQYWNPNVKEWSHQGERKMRKMGKHLLFALKVSFIVQSGLMLHSLCSERDPIDHVVDFASLGVSALVLFTAILFLSGYVAPGSCWGWVDWQRQKRARRNHRFGIRHIAITELWITYIVISCGLLRVFVFSPLGIAGEDRRGCSICNLHSPDSYRGHSSFQPPKFLGSNATFCSEGRPAV
jgi:hypothetical protein